MKSSQNILDGASAAANLEGSVKRFLADLKENIFEVLASAKITPEEEKKITALINQSSLAKLSPEGENRLTELFDDFEKSVPSLVKTFVKKAESDQEAAVKAERTESAAAKPTHQSAKASEAKGK